MKTATEIWIKEIPICKCGLKCIAPTSYVVEKKIEDEGLTEMNNFLKQAGFSSRMLSQMIGSSVTLRRMFPVPLKDESGTPICAYCAVKKGLVSKDILEEQW